MLVSVIIPALNEAENIQACIAAARRGYTPDQVEIIVVDGGSQDGTPELALEGTSVGDLVQPQDPMRSPKVSDRGVQGTSVGDLVQPQDHPHRQVRVLHAPRGRAVQMNRGAANAQGEIFVFCHADSQLPEDWREAVIEALSTPEVSGGTFQTLILPANWMLKIRNRWVFPANWKIMFGDQVQFMRRSTFEAVGGFPEIPLMEDVEMSRALNEVGQVIRIPPQHRVITSSRRFAERGFLRQSLLNGLSMLRYLYLGATPEDIARVYRSSREENVLEDEDGEQRKGRGR